MNWNLLLWEGPGEATVQPQGGMLWWPHPHQRSLRTPVSQLPELALGSQTEGVSGAGQGHGNKMWKRAAVVPGYCSGKEFPCKRFKWVEQELKTKDSGWRGRGTRHRVYRKIIDQFILSPLYLSVKRRHGTSLV